jgi:hypothetical protein
MLPALSYPGKKSSFSRSPGKINGNSGSICRKNPGLGKPSMTLRRSHVLKNFVRKAGGVFREVISKLILGVILHQLRELYGAKKHPPFLKGGRGE